MEHGVLLAVVSVAGVGVFAQWLAWRLGLPAIVILLLAGLAIGPGLGLIDPTDDFGDQLQPLIALVVGIIVFEGGLNLGLRELRSAGAGVLRLTVLALPLNWAFGAVAAHYVGGLSWPVATLFGAIMVVTGPTVILPLLRQNKLHRRPASFLKWEGIVNDPIGAVLAIVVLEFLVLSAGHPDEQAVATEIGRNLLLGVALALALGVALAWGVRELFVRDLAPEILKTPMLLASVLVLYAVANLFQEEAGLIATTVFGLALANLGITGIQELKRFKESLTILLVSGLFIVLTADLEPRVFRAFSWNLLALTLAVMFVVRPLAILIATIGSGMTWRERLLVAWIAPRGIVAAAVAGIAAARLEAAGYPDAVLIQPMVFAVIAATVVAHGFTIRPLARWLGLSAADRPGLLIVGASSWSTDLAGLLQTLGVSVVLMDSSWNALRTARRRGIPSVCGEVLSEHVEEVVDPNAVDYALAATHDDAYNALVCARLAPELGRERVHQLALHSGRLDPHRIPSREWRGKIVGEAGLDFASLAELYDEDWTLVARPIEESPGKAMIADPDQKPLVLVHADGELSFVSPERPFAPEPGDTVVAFQRRGDTSSAGPAARGATEA